jgi:hypothetical protein
MNHGCTGTDGTGPKKPLIRIWDFGFRILPSLEHFLNLCPAAGD